jgi:plasmid replication initiation protein
MTALELLKAEIADSGKQLEAVLSSFPAAQIDSKPASTAMSAREIVVHLCEAYDAAAAASEGREYDWGSYVPPSTEWHQLLANFRELRAKAAEALSAEDDTKLMAGTMYIVAHDYYHVGQLCSARIACDPEWDPFSIYA